MRSFPLNFVLLVFLLECNILKSYATSYRFNSYHEKLQVKRSKKDVSTITTDTSYDKTDDKHNFELYDARKKNQFVNSVFMDPDSNYLLQWDFNKTHIIFEVQVKTLGWVGLGLSTNGAMTNSDIAVMWIKNGKLTLQDRFAKGFFEPLKDKTDDLIPVYSYENETHTVVAFTRLLDTCDTKMDRRIVDDATSVLYAYHSKDPPNGKLMKHEIRGSKVLFLTNINPKSEIPPHTKKLSFRANNFEVPSDQKTTYKCFVHKFHGIKKKYHLIMINPEIESNMTHHMVFHICESTFKNVKKLKQFNCYSPSFIRTTSRCMILLDIWAVGGQGYNFPSDIGYPITPDMNRRYVIIEVHYNNPDLKKGIIDRSGFTLYLSDKLRKYDANMLATGIGDFSWGMMIPPKQKEFQLNALCSAECTDNIAIPETGINIFSYYFHTHLIGKKIRLRLIRNGEEIRSINDDNYNFNYQVRKDLKIPLNVRKNDSLIMECIYSSENRENYTFGGLGTEEEMCIGVFLYYPKTTFGICGSTTNYKGLIDQIHLNKSLVNDNFLQNIMTYNMQEGNNTVINTVNDELNTPKGRSPEQISNLQNFYKSHDTYTICSYTVIPEIKKVSMPVYKPLKKQQSQCSNY